MPQLGTLSERIKAEVTDTVANKSFSLFVVPFCTLTKGKKDCLPSANLLRQCQRKLCKCMCGSSNKVSIESEQLLLSMLAGKGEIHRYVLFESTLFLERWSHKL